MAIEITDLGSVREDSTAYITVTFKDKDGNLQVPSTVDYRIDDVYSKTAVRGSASLSPASSIEITLTPADNAIVDDSKEVEIREMTVSITFGAGLEAHQAARWNVENLLFKS